MLSTHNAASVQGRVRKMVVTKCVWFFIFKDARCTHLYSWGSEPMARVPKMAREKNVICQEFNQTKKKKSMILFVELLLKRIR